MVVIHLWCWVLLSLAPSLCNCKQKAFLFEVVLRGGVGGWRGWFLISPHLQPLLTHKHTRTHHLHVNKTNNPLHIRQIRLPSKHGIIHTSPEHTPSVQMKSLHFPVSVHYNLTWANQFYSEFTCLPKPCCGGRSLRNVMISFEQREYLKVFFKWPGVGAQAQKIFRFTGISTCLSIAFSNPREACSR